jgi:NAD(P)H-flavin reductase
MTEKEIFEIASKHLVYYVGEYEDDEWFGDKQDVLEFAREICEKNDFYKTRCELLQKVQKYMRDPERQIVCDILANNSLLQDPSGKRYGQDLKKLIVL